MYKEIADTDGKIVQRLEDGAFICTDSGNIDAQTYAHWLSEGGVLQPADLPDPNIAIRQQIAQIEADSQVTAPLRVFMLADFQAQYQQMAEQMTAAGTPTTAEQLLARNIMYQKALAVDRQVKALEAQLTS